MEWGFVRVKIESRFVWFDTKFVNMSPSSWITSFSCSSSVAQSSEDTALSPIFQWLRFIFLSPCPQRALLSSIDILFLLALTVFSIQKLYSKFATGGHHAGSDINKPLIRNGRAVVHRTTLWFKLSLIVTVLLALAYTILCILAFVRNTQLEDKLTHVTITKLILHERRFQAVSHPLPLRIYWVANFIIISLFSVSGVIRVIPIEELDFVLRVDDIISFISFLLSIVLLMVAIKGSTGITVKSESDSVMDVEPELYEPLLNGCNVSGFAKSSIISKAFWLWMNPLLSKVYKSPLKSDDIPTLLPEHRAERMSALFELNWPKPHEKSKHPVRTMLLRCFWREIAFTAFLAIVCLCVMYVGPVLIHGFVDFTSGKGSSPYEGYYLVFTLLIAKFVEVLTSHQFNFNSQKLGMPIRSALITSLNKKGLRMSCSARQAHGVRQIVNYMAVDAQQLSDMMLQLHVVWLMPLQVSVALILLSRCLGTLTITALVGLVVVMLFVLMGTRMNNRF
ncbi:unnamed protein product [Camellia sinensis]